MDKLISKDALLKVLHGWHGDCLSMAEEMGDEAVIQAETIRDVICEIENAPVIEDVAPVVHGRWVKTDYKPMIFTKCSVCGRRVEIQNKSNYCPKCGAKMDRGGVNDS